MKNVLIYGWFGENNVGDELLLKTILEMIADNKRITPFVACSNPNEVKKNHKVKIATVTIDGSIKKFIKALFMSPISLIKCMYETETLIVAGGGAISDWNDASTKEMFYLINWFAKRKKSIYLLGIGAGPIMNEKPGGYFTTVLNKASEITVRDIGSLTELEKIGVKNVQLSNDLVSYSTLGQGESYQAKMKKIGIVVVPVCQSTPEVLETMREEWNKLILLLDGAYEVSIIPFQMNYDMAFIQSLEFNHKTVKVCKPKKLWDTIDFVRQQDCIIGMRYHSLILSILLGKKFIPIIYHNKTAELCKEYGVEKYACSIGNGENWVDSNIDAQDIFDKIKQLEHDGEFTKRNKMILDRKREKNIEREILRKI